ncbi:MAG: hypothetical protein COA86_12040 [Kangiella sp.]|nr:MAG: hypothetical protein COA86_12040 [Kangiella sp.]
MAVKLEDRPIEKVREEVVDQLTMNYGHGELSLEAFEKRLDIAMESSSHSDIFALTEDLTLEVDQKFTEHKEKEVGQRVDSSNSKDFESITQIFSSNTRSGKWNVAKKTEFYSLFSSGNIDLTDATFSQQTVHIKVFSLFSAIDILIPENINVVCKASCIFSNFENQSSSIIEGNPPTLIVEGISVFSSLEVKLKRTFKEKMRDFADGFKKMFV